MNRLYSKLKEDFPENSLTYFISLAIILCSLQNSTEVGVNSLMVDIVEYIYFVAAFDMSWGMFLVLANLLEVILTGLLTRLAVKLC